jgi:dephospho-CoA kinase
VIILGLTGSIGMGKSTVAGMLRRQGVPVWDADAQVHTLYARGGAAVPVVRALVPGAIVDGAVDRRALAQAILADAGLLPRLEAGVHPLVRRAEQRFVRRHRARGAALVALDVPLLLERPGWWHRCHAVAVVSAPAWMQRQRVRARPGMSAAKFAAILARQMPDLVKRRLADYCLPTGLGRAYTWRAVVHMVAELRARERAQRLPKTIGAKPCVRSFWTRKQLAWTQPKATG